MDQFEMVPRYKHREMMPNAAGVYGIYSEGSGKWYIGKSVCIKRRIADHLRSLRLNKHRNHALQNSYNKYAGMCFYVCVLELCDSIVASEKERTWIPRCYSYTNGFNMTDGGENGSHNAFVRHKISKSLKGRKRPPFSAEWRKNMSNERKKRTMSPEVRAKISASLKGRVFSDEWRAKLSAGQKRSRCVNEGGAI
jgi:group I intron endonuclease